MGSSSGSPPRETPVGNVVSLVNNECPGYPFTQKVDCTRNFFQEGNLRRDNAQTITVTRLQMSAQIESHAELRLRDNGLGGC